MKEIIANMIIGTTETQAPSDDKFVLWGIIISAIVSFIVAKVQTRSAEKNLNTQIQSEIEKVERQYDLELQKIEKQYTFEQKRDNTNFIVKLRIEKATELISALDELINLSSYYHNNSIKKAKREEFDYKKLSQFTNTEAKVSILINYFSVLRQEWKDIKMFLMETDQAFIKIYLDKVTLTEDGELELFNKNFEYQTKLRGISRQVSMINDEILNRLEE